MKFWIFGFTIKFVIHCFKYMWRQRKNMKNKLTLIIISMTTLMMIMILNITQTTCNHSQIQIQATAVKKKVFKIWILIRHQIFSVITFMNCMKMIEWVKIILWVLILVQRVGWRRVNTFLRNGRLILF